MVIISNAINFEEQLKEDGIKTSLQVLMINSIRTETIISILTELFNQHIYMKIKQEQNRYKKPLFIKSTSV